MLKDETLWPKQGPPINHYFSSRGQKDRFFGRARLADLSKTERALAGLRQHKVNSKYWTLEELLQYDELESNFLFQ
jgi:hypothetical protein